MNKKKFLYIAAIVVVLGLGYLNYFGTEKELTPKEQVVETTDVTYNSDGYDIEAVKQKDILKSDETTFESAKAKIKDMVLSGDNVLLDAAKNLILKTNILGRSVNGWEFKTESAKYIKEKDEVVATDGVTAINKERGIEISGKNFKTNSKMSFVDLTGDVVLKSKGIELKADSATYSDETKDVLITGNISLSGKDLGEEKGILAGKFTKGKYNIDKKILEAWEPFNLDYNGVQLFGNKLWYDENTGAFRITEDVYILVDGYKIHVSSIENKGNTNIIDINGKIKGSNGVYSFEADKGYYDTKSKQLEVIGNLKGNSTEGQELEANKMIYDRNNGIMQLFGGKNKLVYKTKDEVIKTDELRYNSNTKELEINTPYTYKSSIYESTGKKFFINNETGIGYVIDGSIKNIQKKEWASGDRVDFNRTLNNYYIKGNAQFEDPKYTFKSQIIDYRGSEGFTYLPVAYEFTQKGQGDIFKGGSGEYNMNLGDFKSFGDFSYEDKENLLTGTNLTYNTKTEIGNIEKNIVILKKSDNTKVTGDTGNFKKDDYAKLIGNLVLKNEKIEAFSKEGTYNMKNSKLYIPGEITFKGIEKPMDGRIEDGIYDVNISKFTGKKFTGKDVNNSLKSDIINYYAKEERVELEGNAQIKNATSILNGSILDYNLKTEEATSPKAFTLNYDNFIVKGTNGKTNLGSNTLFVNKVHVTTQDGDNITADEASGNMEEMRLDFIGNVKGKVMDKGVPVIFDGKFARAYFKKENDKYKAQRLEIKEDAVITKEEMTLYSDYLEMDVPKNIVFGRENTRIKIQDRNGTTDITSRVADANLTTEIANLVGDVTIINKNLKGQVTKTTSSRAIVKNKENIIELIGDVVADSEESTVEADKAIYNMQTNKMKALGNVFVNYKSAEGSGSGANTGNIINKNQSKDPYKNFMKK